MKFLVSLLALAALGGCAHTPGQTSVAGGECKFLERPQYAVKGARSYDQDWIDSTVEGGVGACGWQRPAARPAALDSVKAKSRPAAPKNKPGWLSLVHGLRTKPVAEPAPVQEAPAAEEPAPLPAPIAPKRPIDQLLGVLK